MIKFTRANWARFDTHNKKTTTRDHPIKPGYHAASTGRYQSYARLGTAYVHPFNKTCKAKELTHEDAINDGFDSLCEYIIELAHLNKGLTADTQVWIHPTDKVKS